MDNKLTPENEKNTEQAEEKSTAIEPEYDETPEIDETLDNSNETAEDSADESNVPLNAEPIHNNGGLVRSAITAAIVLTVFVCVYFVFTFFNAQKPNTPKPAPSQSPLASAALGNNPADSSKNTSAPVENSADVPQTKQDTVPSEAVNPEPTENVVVPNVKYSHEEAMKMAQQAAKTQFGDDAIVFPASDAIPQQVDIDGEKRWCYMFGADSMANVVKNNSMKGLYHFDANTGEIFDNQDGTMVKIDY